MRFLILILSLSFFSHIGSATTINKNSSEQQYLFVAVWAPNVNAKEIQEFVIDGFKDKYPDENITPVVYRTNDVLAALMGGFAHIGITSRQWSDKDITLLVKKFKQQPLELTVSADAFALVLNEENPISSLSLEEVKGLFAKGNDDCEAPQISNWQQIAQDKFEDYSVVKALSYEPEKRTSKVFNAMLCGDLTADQLSSKNDALSEVDDEVHAVTYISYADELPEAVVPMRGTGGDIIPIRDDTVFSGEYPLSVVYYMQIAPFAMEHSSTQLYIDYLLSDDVQQRLQEQGFAKLPEAIVHRNKVKLKQANAKYPMGYR